MLTRALERGTGWLVAAVQSDPLPAAPVGLYLANLWYFEELYPYVFGLAGLGDLAQANRRG
jgi:hypothetical protein